MSQWPDSNLSGWWWCAVIDDDRPTVVFDPQMISRRRSRFRHPIGGDLSGLRRDDLLTQSGRIIIDRHCRRRHCGRCRFRWRIPRRSLGASDESVGHVDGHFPVRTRVVSCPVIASFAAVTGAATTATARSSATTYYYYYY